ncbi:relaxase/mobilization nuclease domain-containing protein [Aliarcobacter butzleri]|uniref:relaxase/mobilization nuclease domain-containing protein n=1 Tax=Aliarcobacter butzleri TaxID=28197 RepID=UPI003AFB5ED7
MLLDEIEEELNRRKVLEPIEKFFYPTYERGKYQHGKIPVIKNISLLGGINTKNALEYIIKNTNDGLLFSKDGEKISVEDKYNEWKKAFSLLENSKEALHLIFIINENKNEKNFKALEKSVIDTLRQNFFEYDYVYVLHTTQKKPHVHVILNKRNIFTKKKLHLNNNDFKAFFGKLRNDFANNLNSYNKDFNYKSYYNDFEIY